jgi:hypothetical protein
LENEGMNMDMVGVSKKEAVHILKLVWEIVLSTQARRTIMKFG